MSTVLGFPDATSPTPETGVLWLTEGSGTTRDKKVTAGALVTDLLGVAIDGQAAAASPIAGATDTVPVSRGGTGGKASVDDVVSAGLAGGISGLPTASTLGGTEIVPLVQGGSGAGVAVSSLVGEGLQEGMGDLPSPVAALGTDTIPLLQSGTLRNAPLSSIREYMGIPGELLSLSSVWPFSPIYDGYASDEFTTSAPESRIAVSRRDGQAVCLDIQAAFIDYLTTTFNATQAGLKFPASFSIGTRVFPALVPCVVRQYDVSKAQIGSVTCYADVRMADADTYIAIALSKSDGTILLWADILQGAGIEYAVLTLSTVVVVP